jgi:hypothetical protein
MTGPLLPKLAMTSDARRVGIDSSLLENLETAAITPVKGRDGQFRPLDAELTSDQDVGKLNSCGSTAKPFPRLDVLP